LSYLLSQVPYTTINHLAAAVFTIPLLPGYQNNYVQIPCTLVKGTAGTAHGLPIGMTDSKPWLLDSVIHIYHRCHILHTNERSDP